MLKKAILQEFRQIPGVGKTIAEDFWALGLRSLDDLKGEDAEALYARLCELQNVQVDRFVLKKDLELLLASFL